VTSTRVILEVDRPLQVEVLHRDVHLARWVVPVQHVNVHHRAPRAPIHFAARDIPIYGGMIETVSVARHRQPLLHIGLPEGDAERRLPREERRGESQ